MNGSVYDDQIANLARLEAQREKLNSDYEAFREQAELFHSELEKLGDKQKISEALRAMHEADFAL
ncbi:hypothetical protein MAF45_00605 [Mesosutterella sp. OilRF-GAM-744-9]|uniref:ABC transporter Uup C-terminal domain-containing protein n=1 Tax=Mesosutterella porci TaxID=2915351 RepID=A0ABS9MMW1_9BURK|nr:hypothetical protein [Mesosutterella sp. oilRF-744-WT-GAM-9]MCG5029958.1 hypothetical protein [Mesosutterella sp. oilRF-744-WT-GAM-9]